MQRITGTVLANGRSIEFNALNVGERWTVAVKAVGGLAQQGESVGLAPWSTIATMVDTALDASRKRLLPHMSAQPEHRNGKSVQVSQSRPRRRVRQSEASEPLARPVDGEEPRPVVGAGTGE
jgi:hypothetical protein